MMRILRHPATNACCLSLFTVFYAIIFWVASPAMRREGGIAFEACQTAGDSLWKDWCAFLADGHQTGIVYAMLFFAAAAVVLLVLRRHPYDEYHTALLTQCLAVAAVLTLAAIAVFFVLILRDPAFIIVKFTLFITIHWVTVVLADLVYVFLCRWR